MFDQHSLSYEYCISDNTYTLLLMQCMKKKFNKSLTVIIKYEEYSQTITLQICKIKYKILNNDFVL